MAILGTAWNVVSFSARNLTPIGSKGRILWTVLGGASLGLAALAPATAFTDAASALNTLAANEDIGITSYVKKGLGLTLEGGKVAAIVATAVADEAPRMYTEALGAANDAMAPDA